MRRPAPKPPLTLADRLVSAAFGAVFGAIVAVIFAVFAVRAPVGGGLWMLHFVPWFAGAFALFGLLFGSLVGEVLGAILGAAISPEEESGDIVLPRWMVVVLFAVAALLFWHWVA